ncbi:MAG: penicillin acylase family protein [Bacillota bacterium]
MLRLFGLAGALFLALLLAALATGAAPLHALALLMALATAGALGVLQRSRPPGRGTVPLEGLRAPAAVRRDERGAPHITAENWHDLFQAQGYIAAQERLWQMEIARRAAAGRLAELLGESFLERDRFMRALGLYPLAERSLADCPEDVRACLEAYAEGVNAFLRSGRLPPEFLCARLRPEPWRAVDSLAVAKLLAFELAPPVADALVRARVAQVAGPAWAASLFDGDPTAGSGTTNAPLDGLPDLGDLCSLAAWPPLTVSGGTAWAVAGDRTASGRPIAGCTLETAPRAPSPLHPLTLQGPGGMRLTGVALAGLPGLLVGQSRHFAWGIAPSGLGAPELVPEPPEAVQSREIHIRVRGRDEPVTCTVHVGRAGPVLARDERGAVALRSPVLQPGREVAALLGINQARSYDEFRAALQSWTAPGLAVVYAGADGTVARLETGPELREEVSPADGVAVGGPAAAAERIRAVAGSRTEWTLERLAPLTFDTASLEARSLLQPLLQALQEGLRQGARPETLTELEKRALLVLSDWSGEEPAGSAGACLWERWYFDLAEAILRPRLGLTLFNQLILTPAGQGAVERLILRALRGEESPWLPLEGDFGLPRLALAAFRRAVAYLAARQGRSPERWAWGREHRIRFRHSLAEALPALGPLADLGPHPLGGGPSAVHRSSLDPTLSGTVTAATTCCRAVDLARPGEPVAILAPGAGGHPLDPSFAGQLLPWLRGELLPPGPCGDDVLRLVPAGK